MAVGRHVHRRVRAHLLTSRHAAPLLIQHRDEHPGLIVSAIAWAFGAYLGNVLYDTAEAATARMAFGMAEDLRPHNVAAVAVAPGHLGVTETPEYLGRAIATPRDRPGHHRPDRDATDRRPTRP
jgi:NAD(P)-dependent dehydrogenase (short-subunit alcohol dehydrogenase family)